MIEVVLGILNLKNLVQVIFLFVKSINAYNNVQPKKVQDNFQQKITYLRNNFYSSKINKSFNKPSCFYCNYNRHTYNICYMVRYGVSNGKYIWVKKGTNQKDPKSFGEKILLL